MNDIMKEVRDKENQKALFKIGVDRNILLYDDDAILSFSERLVHLANVCMRRNCGYSIMKRDPEYYRGTEESKLRHKMKLKKIFVSNLYDVPKNVHKKFPNMIEQASFNLEREYEKLGASDLFGKSKIVMFYAEGPRFKLDWYDTCYMEMLIGAY